jgi:DNA-binding Lrp family transcriptional regulator
MNALDESIVRATQAGLPLCAEPWRAVASAVGIAQQQLLARLEAMLADGRIRRIGAVPNHYALGYTANAMSVWDVADEAVDELGAQVGALPCVSHCYRRPRRPPQWRFNLFAMVHGRSRDETEAHLADIRAVLAPALRASDVLYSTRMLKKTGMRLA